MLQGWWLVVAAAAAAAAAAARVFSVLYEQLVEALR